MSEVATVDLDEEDYRRWHATALSSLRMAGIARDAGEHHHACLHAEQAAQQVVKGLLHGVGIGVRARGHDLVALGEEAASSAGAQLDDAIRDALTRLARHYLPARYPDALPGGTPADRYRPRDAAQALDDAETAVEMVETTWRALQEAAGSSDDGEGTS